MNTKYGVMSASSRGLLAAAHPPVAIEVPEEPTPALPDVGCTISLGPDTRIPPPRGRKAFDKFIRPRGRW